VFQRAVRLREAVFRTFSAIAAGRQVNSANLGAIRDEVRAAYQHGRLAWNGGAFEWQFPADREALDSVLWPIAKNAVDLLADGQSLAAMRECASDRCAWLFLDRSRNGTRRWCDMKVCGNRAKSRRHYRRARDASAD
jgi:predicted RNA-binding Zn ribbon-like protein